MFFLYTLFQLVNFVLMSVITVSVGSTIKSYLNTRAKFYGFLAGMIILSSLLSFLGMAIMRHQTTTNIEQQVIK